MTASMIYLLYKLQKLLGIANGIEQQKANDEKFLNYHFLAIESQS